MELERDGKRGKQTEKERGGEYGTDVASWRERQARNEQGGHHHEQPLRRAPPFGAVAGEALLGPRVTSPALVVEACGGWWGLGQCFFPTRTEVFWIGRLDTTWLIRHALAEPQLRAGMGAGQSRPARAVDSRGCSLPWPPGLAPPDSEGSPSLAAAWTCLLPVFSDTCSSFSQAPQRRTWSPVKCIGNRMVGVPGHRCGVPQCSPVEVPHHVALHLGRRAPQHHGLRPRPLALAARLPLDIGVPQSCADVIEEPGQWAQLQEGLLEGEGCYLGAKCPALHGPQRGRGRSWGQAGRTCYAGGGLQTTGTGQRGTR